MNTVAQNAKARARKNQRKPHDAELNRALYNLVFDYIHKLQITGADCCAQSDEVNMTAASFVGEIGALIGFHETDEWEGDNG